MNERGTSYPLDAQEARGHDFSDWVRGGIDLIKRYWIVGFLTAYPSVAEAQISFNEIWDQLRSGRDNKEQVEKIIKQRFPNSSAQQELLKDFASFNEKLEHELAMLPINEIAAYFDSIGVDFESLTQNQRDYRILPLDDALLFGQVDSTIHATLFLNPNKKEHEDTLGVTQTAVHELGHLFMKRQERTIPLVPNEGYAEWGASNFLLYHLRKKYNNDESKIEEDLTLMKDCFTNSGEVILVSLLATMTDDNNALHNFYNGDTTRTMAPFNQVMEINPDMQKVFYKDIANQSALTAPEVLQFIHFMIKKYGIDHFKRTYEQLRKNEFIDYIAPHLGKLSWDRDIIYFDNTRLNVGPRSSAQMQGSLTLLSQRGKTTELLYDQRGTWSYNNVVDEVEKNLDFEYINPQIKVNPRILLKERDGTLRPEIYELLSNKKEDK